MGSALFWFCAFLCAMSFAIGMAAGWSARVRVIHHTYEPLEPDDDETGSWRNGQ